MDWLYHKLFAEHDPEDRWYCTNIPKLLKCDDAKLLLQRDVRHLQQADMTEQEWDEAKNHLLRDQERWCVCVFDFDSLPEHGGAKRAQLCKRKFNVLFDVLENKPSRYFQVWKSVQNCCFLRGFSNIWKIIPTPPPSGIGLNWPALEQPKQCYCDVLRCWQHICEESDSRCKDHVMTIVNTKHENDVLQGYIGYSAF